MGYLSEEDDALLKKLKGRTASPTPVLESLRQERGVLGSPDAEAAEKAAAEGTGVNKDGSFTGKSVVAPPIGTGTTAKLPSGIPPPSPIKGK